MCGDFSIYQSLNISVITEPVCPQLKLELSQETDEVIKTHECHDFYVLNLVFYFVPVHYSAYCFLL